MKTYQAVLTKCDLSTVSEPGSIPPPTADPYSAVPEYRSGSCTVEDDGACGVGRRRGARDRLHDRLAAEQGDPGRRRPPVDVDLVGRGEKTGGPTYAAITARSYHPGGVNALFGDGSVRFVKSSINGVTWRALGTIGGGEVISADAF